MLTESEVRSRVRDALEVVTPPAPWLAGRIQKAVEVQTPAGPSRRGLRVSLRAVAAVTLIVVAIASLATFLISRSSPTRTAPAGPSAPSYPTSSSYSRGFAFGGVAMVTPTDGWDGGEPFQHTTDGGVHWIDVTPKGVGRNFEDYYVDATHAWFNNWSESGPLQLTTFRTADRGRTWERGTPLTIGADASGLADDRFYFLDPDHGWLLVSTTQTTNGTTLYADTIYRTQDGGLHWTIAAVHAAPLGWTSRKFYCYEWCGQVTFISASTGWLSTYRDTAPVGPALLVTRDGGITWTQQALPPSKVPCPCVVSWFEVLDDLHAMFLLQGPNTEAFSSALAMTSDGGNTWVVRSLPGEAQMIVGFYDMQHGWAVAGSRATMIFQPPASVTSPTLPLPLYWTDDGGLTWKRVQTDLQLQGAAGRIVTLYFVDSEVGFAIRQPTENGLWQLLRTTDGGRTWTLIASNL